MKQDRLGKAFSLFLQCEHLYRAEPTDENQHRYGLAKWNLHQLIKQNYEILNHYSNQDNGQVATEFLNGKYGKSVPCKNC